MRSTHLALAAFAWLLAGCASDVRIEDDGDARDGASDDGSPDDDATDDDAPSVGTSDGGGATGAASGGAEGGGSTAAERSELETACDDLCTTRCVASTRYCERDCAESVDACVALKLAAVRCQLPGETGPCPEEADPEACQEAWSDYWGCLDRWECGHSTHQEATVCSEETSEACDCREECDQGHTAQATCVLGDLEEICQCYFDGTYRGECRQSGVDVQCRAAEATCCMGFYR